MVLPQLLLPLMQQLRRVVENLFAFAEKCFSLTFTGEMPTLAFARGSLGCITHDSEIRLGLKLCGAQI